MEGIKEEHIAFHLIDPNLSKDGDVDLILLTVENLSIDI